MKEKENLELIGNVSQSVLASMKGLGSELERYYLEATMLDMDAEEAEKKAAAKYSSRKKKDTRSLKYKLFGDFLPAPQKKRSDNPSSKKLGDGARAAHGVAWASYNYFKKAHRMITW